LEFIAVLTRIGSTVGRKRPAPEDALHIGDAARVGTVSTRARVNAGISLKVDVEGQTASSLETLANIYQNKIDVRLTALHLAAHALVS
jgi:hypothetical protein